MPYNYLFLLTFRNPGRQGATLTLTRTNANLLIAFIAFFVTVVATHLWGIICFTIHYCYSSPEPRDGLYHQRQAILRNSQGPMTSLLTAVQLGWAWRRVTRPYWLLLPLAVLAVLFALGTALASGFSSRVAMGSDAGSEVLLSGAGCGIATVPTLDIPDLNAWLRDLIPTSSNALVSAANYVGQCYSGTAPHASSRCRTFVQPRLPTTVNRTAACPFGRDLCRSRDSNLALDSGFLDSHRDLGINAPENERFLYRRVAQCAPLRTEGFKSSYNATEDRSYTRYYYGKANDAFNHTYQYSNTAMYEELLSNLTSALPDYKIG